MSGPGDNGPQTHKDVHSGSRSKVVWFKSKDVDNLFYVCSVGLGPVSVSLRP